jgi:hypothetical protein
LCTFVVRRRVDQPAGECDRGVDAPIVTALLRLDMYDIHDHTTVEASQVAAE